jgi:hypothetical protein
MANSRAIAPLPNPAPPILLSSSRRAASTIDIVVRRDSGNYGASSSIVDLTRVNHAP